jgi:hypothetical protein
MVFKKESNCAAKIQRIDQETCREYGLRIGTKDFVLIFCKDKPVSSHVKDIWF